MNIAEYIEQNCDRNVILIPYSKFVTTIGLKDERTAREWAESDLQELFKCRIITTQDDGCQHLSCLIYDMYFTDEYFTVHFSDEVGWLREDDPHWLSDILQQTRMNNYIVIGKEEIEWLVLDK